MNDTAPRSQSSPSVNAGALDDDTTRPGDAATRTPASFSQRRLWFLDRLLPVRTLYNVGHALRLTGELDVDALRRALNELVRRHEVLRTRFVLVAGEPMQEIVSEVVLPLEPEDLCALPTEERKREAHRRASEEARI